MVSVEIHGQGCLYANRKTVETVRLLPLPTEICTKIISQYEYSKLEIPFERFRDIFGVGVNINQRLAEGYDTEIHQ